MDKAFLTNVCHVCFTHQNMILFQKVMSHPCTKGAALMPSGALRLLPAAIGLWYMYKMSFDLVYLVLKYKYTMSINIK